MPRDSTTSNTSGLWGRLLALGLLAGLTLGFWQYEAIRDWWLLRNYQPPAEIAALATKARLSEEGRRFFYLGKPQLDDKQAFAEHCPVAEAEGSLVLGCYAGGRIYILRVTRPELAQVMEVTAAHEMLHAAYDRLGQGEAGRLNRQLETFYRQIENPELEQTLKDYEQTEPGQRLNELHSLLPTQLPGLSPELENYYRRYFSDQDQVAASYLAYRGVFQAAEAKIAALREEVSGLRSQTSGSEASIAAQRNEIETMGEQMDELRASGQTNEYNAMVPTYNSLVRSYNAAISRYRDLIALHNAKVEELNQLALEQNELVDSLDSTKFQPL